MTLQRTRSNECFNDSYVIFPCCITPTHLTDFRCNNESEAAFRKSSSLPAFGRSRIVHRGSRTMSLTYLNSDTPGCVTHCRFDPRLALLLYNYVYARVSIYIYIGRRVAQGIAICLVESPSKWTRTKRMQ